MNGTKTPKLNWKKIWQQYKTYPFFINLIDEMRQEALPNPDKWFNEQKLVVNSIVQSNRYIDTKNASAYRKKLLDLVAKGIPPVYLDELATEARWAICLSKEYLKEARYKPLDKDIYLDKLKKLKRGLDFFKSIIFEHIAPLCTSKSVKLNQSDLEACTQQLITAVDQYATHPPSDKKRGPIKNDFRDGALLDLFLLFHGLAQLSKTAALKEIDDLLDKLGLPQKFADHLNLEQIINRAGQKVINGMK